MDSEAKRSLKVGELEKKAMEKENIMRTNVCVNAIYESII